MIMSQSTRIQVYLRLPTFQTTRVCGLYSLKRHLPNSTAITSPLKVEYLNAQSKSWPDFLGSTHHSEIAMPMIFGLYLRMKQLKSQFWLLVPTQKLILTASWEATLTHFWERTSFRTAHASLNLSTPMVWMFIKVIGATRANFGLLLFVKKLPQF